MADLQNDPFLGTRIREYEIQEILGKGGMGAVYRARHVLLEEDRAIKIIHSRLSGDHEFVERFKREARILTRLHHPNLVQLFEFGMLEGDVFFMVLEFLQGESLLHRIKRQGKIPLHESIRIAREAALGLHSAHKKGITHRDISPDNLLLVKNEAGEETTKIIDFGIAKPNEKSREMTSANLFLGKPEYCSPEQCGLLNEGEIVDHRSDIYSLGITLYEMIAGKLPFYSATPQGYLVKHASEKHKPLSSHFVVGVIPPALDRVLDVCLAKRREERFESAEQLASALDQVLLPEQLPTIDELSPDAVTIKGAEGLAPGTLFAKRFHIEQKLGHGGFGAVYKAKDTILNVNVALKVMKKDISHNPQTIERFKREVVIARKVTHPNACRIYDIGESDGMQYVSMEYLEGKTLAEVLNREHRVAPDLAINIIGQVLAALAEVHRVGIIHRDLKPQNIMVDDNYHVSIMDFGISISADVNRMTQTGMLIGTLHYMSPEQMGGIKIDHRSDIYSIGVILFEIVTGTLPFEATNPLEIIMAHCRISPPKPKSIVPEIPLELEEIILKSLAKDPNERYQSVLELQRDLKDVHQTVKASRAEIARKMIAKRNYSQAMRLLKGLVKEEPNNEEWHKLLKLALLEQTKKQLLRTKSFLKKGNLLKAKSLIEKINRLHPDNSQVISRIKKLQDALHRRTERNLKECLTELEKRVRDRDWAGALETLKSAYELKKTDPRVLQWQERLAVVQASGSAETFSLDQQMLQAKLLMEQKDWNKALTQVDLILTLEPQLSEAVDLRDAISKTVASKIVHHRSPMKFIIAVGVAVACLAASYFWYAASHPTKPVMPPFKEQSLTPIAVPVSINALPWAKVKLTSSSNAPIPIAEADTITPCNLMLRPGEYSLELANGLSLPIRQKIQVGPGKPTYYQFDMPAYDPRKALLLSEQFK